MGWDREWAIRELQEASNRLQVITTKDDYRRQFAEVDQEQLVAMKVQIDAIINRMLGAKVKSGIWGG